MSEEKKYSYLEVIEILRQVMFTGTPEFYDNGGVHGNHNLSKDHTTKRAKQAFDKYYLSEQLPESKK